MFAKKDYNQEAEDNLYDILTYLSTLAGDVTHWAANLDSDARSEDAIKDIIDALEDVTKDLRFAINDNSTVDHYTGA